MGTSYSGCPVLPKTCQMVIAHHCIPQLLAPILPPKWPSPVQSYAILIIVYNGVQCDMFHVYITLESTSDLLIKKY